MFACACACAWRWVRASQHLYGFYDEAEEYFMRALDGDPYNRAIVENFDYMLTNYKMAPYDAYEAFRRLQVRASVLWYECVVCAHVCACVGLFSSVRVCVCVLCRRAGRWRSRRSRRTNSCLPRRRMRRQRLAKCGAASVSVMRSGYVCVTVCVRLCKPASLSFLGRIHALFRVHACVCMCVHIQVCVYARVCMA